MFAPFFLKVKQVQCVVEPAGAKNMPLFFFGRAGQVQYAGILSCSLLVWRGGVFLQLDLCYRNLAPKTCTETI